MAKDLVSEQTLPTPIGPISTGKPKLDAALEQLAVFPHSSAHPSTRPSGNDYTKLVKVANTASSKELLKVLAMKGLLEVGGSKWDEVRYNKLSPAKKKEYKKASDAAATGRKVRIAFLSWLFEAVIPDGYEELLAIVANRKLDPAVRCEALGFLRANFGDHKKKLLEMARAVDASEWNKFETNALAQEAFECWHQADPKGAFEALHRDVTPANATKKYAMIDAVLTSIGQADVQVDPRWGIVMARMVKTDHDVMAAKGLRAMPVDPAVGPELVKALGPLDKIDFLYDGLVEAIARIGTLDVVPILQRAIQLAPDDAETIIAAIPTQAKSVIAAVKATPIEDGDAEARPRATLVYKKVKPFKAPKIPPLAKQEQQLKKLFAEAGIADAYKIVQPSIALLPTRVEERTLKLGATKLGGHPDLPAGAKWPRIRGEPLSFLAQLNFADFAKLTDELPKTGVLAIFVDDDARSERGAYLENAKAIYTKAGTKLERHEVPADFVAKIYQACKVELVATLSLPSYSNAHVTKALDAETIGTYESEVFAHQQVLPKVLGYRDHGYDAEEPATARLLLQLPGDNQTDMEFGDADALSIFIGVKDLAKGNFAKIWPHVGD
jgi:hypothetical protein